MITEIKKGDKFLCTQDSIDKKFYTEHNIYYSEANDCITDNTGEQYHYWTIESVNKYFIKLDIMSDTVSLTNNKEACTQYGTDQIKDNINPDHYKQGKVECIDAIESATVNKKGIEAVCTSQIIKYIWRYESKNGLEDVKKCQWYLEKLIKHLEDGKKV